MISGPMVLFSAMGAFVWLILLAGIGIFVDTLRYDERDVVMDREANMEEHPVMELLFRFMVTLYTVIPFVMLAAAILYAIGL